MVEWNPYSWDAQHAPYPIYRRLRDEAPVYHNEEIGFWALSRYEDVLAAHLDTDTFSSAHGVTIEGIEMLRGNSGMIITKDPPLHTLHRRIVWRVFTPRRIADLEPFIRGLAAELLDRHVDADGFDVVEEFSTLLPLHVIGELLGLPPEFRERLHALADRIIDRSSTTSADVPDDSVAASQELSAMLADVVALRRASPADDIVTMIINAEIDTADEGPRHLTDDDIVTKFLELAFAGHETVAGLIPNGVVALSWYPDARAQLAADPSLIPNAVEEMLRWDPTSRYQGRWTTRDVSLHGQTIPKDSRVVLITGSATHDERVYEEPELFDIHRQIDVPVSFGYGVHHCIGHALARMEIRVAFEELLHRFPDYEIDETSVVRKLAGNNRALAHLRLVHA